MKKHFTLGQFKATETASADQFSVRITGQVLPFVTSSRAPEFELVIDTEHHDKVTITPILSLNHSHAGAEAMAYLQAANIANEHVQLLACHAKELYEDSSGAVYAMLKAMEEQDYEHLEQLMLLTPVLTKKVGGNWAYRSPNDRKDETILDALLFNDKFSPFFEAMEAVTPLVGTEAFKTCDPDQAKLFHIGRIICQKAELADMGQTRSQRRLITMRMMREGKRFADIMKSRETVLEIEKLAKEMAKAIVKELD